MKEYLIDVEIEQCYNPKTLNYSDLPDELRIKLKALTLVQLREVSDILDGKKLQYGMQYETEDFNELLREHNTIDIKPYVAKRLKYKQYNYGMEGVAAILGFLLIISLIVFIATGGQYLSHPEKDNFIMAPIISGIVSVVLIITLCCLSPKSCFAFWKPIPGKLCDGIKYMLTQMCCDLGSTIFFYCSYKVDPIEEL